ncbi:MAG: FtsW/RodA/SpoVE family cell cycle protein, partial [Anaerolineales bacterium]|nr:FtsW/RodA/SpoVE family cell cycle protein [Anaerolineales bacterium]
TGPFYIFQPEPEKLRPRLLTAAGIFLFIYSLGLTFAPVVRARSWSAGFLWQHWLGFALWLGIVLLIHRLNNGNSDPILFPAVALLSGWGLLTIWRLNPTLGLKQTIWLLVSAGALVAGLRYVPNLAFLRRYKYLWLTAGLILAGATFFLGTNPLGAGPRLWLRLGTAYFQPTEFLKLFLIIFLAAYLADRQPLISKLIHLLAPTAVMMGFVLLILLAQRDLGTATVFVIIYTAVVYAATQKRRVLVVSAVTLLAAGLAGYFLFDVVALRVEAWLNPWLDPSGRSYQLVQSMISIAAGGIFGRGPGLGNPGLVPIPHSDFIYTAIVEESGLVGGIALILVLALIVTRGLKIALNAPDAFHRYLATGIAFYIIGQSILIIGGNTRLLPLTGVTLPFVSYGGSSLLTSFIAVFILIHIDQSPQPSPSSTVNLSALLNLGGLSLLGLLTLTIVTGWWAVYRGPDLLARTDNARRSINDRFVLRGAVLDRDGTPLTISEGTPGNYERVYLHPDLGPILGYTHPIYGQSGLEAALDPILRGLEYQPAGLIWYHHLLYGQSPPGLDVRLSLDENLQSAAEELLSSYKGALILIEADSGKILAMASFPTFDPNHLDELFSGTVDNPDGPFVNRATQANYLPGTALGAFLLAQAQLDGTILTTSQNLVLGERTLTCAISPANTQQLAAAVAAGCPGPIAALGEELGAQELFNLFNDLGFYTAPVIRMPVSVPIEQASIPVPSKAAIGQGELRVSPLQMVLAAASLSNGGVKPAPQISVAYQDSFGNPVTISPLASPQQVFTANEANTVTTELQSSSGQYWETVGTAISGETDSLAWYLGGTLANHQGTPLAIVVLLEDGQADTAQYIGSSLLSNAITP